MTAPQPELRILVCGTGDRGDDGAALAAIAHVLPDLPEELRARIEVRRCPQLDVDDLTDVRPEERCLVIDTVVGVEPGSIVTMSLRDLARRADGLAPRSSHALSVDDTLLIAEVVCGALPRGAFVGIGGKWFGYGERFSRIVKGELPAFAAAIRHAIDDLLADADAGAIAAEVWGANSGADADAIADSDANRADRSAGPIPGGRVARQRGHSGR